MLVAIGLLGLLSAAVYSFIWTLFDRETRAFDLARRTQSATILFDRLERDLLMAVASTADGPGLTGDERSMTIFHRAVLAGSPGSPHADLQRTTIRFEPGSGRLMLDRVDARQQGDGQSADPGLFDDELPAEDDTLAMGIRAVRFRYHDGRSWRRTFDSTRGLPSAVEVMLWFGTGGEERGGGVPALTVGDEEPWAGDEWWDDDADMWLGGADAAGRGGITDDGDEVSTPTGPPDRVRVIAIPDAALPAARGSGGGLP